MMFLLPDDITDSLRVLFGTNFDNISIVAWHPKSYIESGIFKITTVVKLTQLCKRDTFGPRCEFGFRILMCECWVILVLVAVKFLTFEALIYYPYSITDLNCGHHVSFLELAFIWFIIHENFSIKSKLIQLTFTA